MLNTTHAVTEKKELHVLLWFQLLWDGMLVGSLYHVKNINSVFLIDTVDALECTQHMSCLWGQAAQFTAEVTEVLAEFDEQETIKLTSTDLSPFIKSRWSPGGGFPSLETKAEKFSFVLPHWFTS